MKRCVVKVLAWVMLVCCCMGQQEIIRADENRTVRVGVYQMEGFHAYNEVGELEGYCIDYLGVVAGLTGWEYEYVMLDDFMECCDKLEAGEIDIMGPAMMSDARKEKFAYSELDLGTEYTVLVTSQNRTDLYYEDYANFGKMKVAVLNDYPLTEYYISYMKIHEFASELVYFDTIEESKKALEEGKVDAIVDSIMDVDEEHKLLAKFNPQPFYFLTNKENTKLLGELNDAMTQVKNSYPSMLNEILLHYYPIYEKQYYTREELEYVQQAKVLKVAYVGDRRPLSFQDENGELKGISRAVFDRIAELSGLKFEYVELDGGQITYEYLLEQDFDLITGVEYNSVNMNSDHLLLSRPYLSARKVLVGRSDFEYDANTTYNLALASGSQTIKDVIGSKYPNLNILDYPSTQSCFAALYMGGVDMLVQNQYVVDGMLSKPIFSTLKVVPLDGVEDVLCFAAFANEENVEGTQTNESRLLISIINKAIAQISDTEMDNMIMTETVHNKYDLDIFDFMYTYRFTFLAVASFFTLVTALGYFYYRERRKHKKILAEEAKRAAVQKRRYETIVDCSDDLIYEISLNGEPSMGSDKIKEKFGWEIPHDVGEIDVVKAMELFHIHPEDEEAFRHTVLHANSGKFDEHVLRIGKTNGDYVWCRIYRTLLMDENNKAISILGKIVDVDEEVKEKRQLELKSRTDMLTGLLNKQTFEKEVRDYVENNSAASSCFVFIDMDHFKDINDKFGHSIGDQVIKEVAKKIQLLFANFDLVGRFGGDEFCVFIKDIPRDTLIDRLRFAVKKMEQEYTYDGVTVKISASIGAAYCKRLHINYKELMDVADQAAYQAKDNGRNCYIIRDLD